MEVGESAARLTSNGSDSARTCVRPTSDAVSSGENMRFAELLALADAAYVHSTTIHPGSNNGVKNPLVPISKSQSDPLSNPTSTLLSHQNVCLQQPPIITINYNPGETQGTYTGCCMKSISQFTPPTPDKAIGEQSRLVAGMQTNVVEDKNVPDTILDNNKTSNNKELSEPVIESSVAAASTLLKENHNPDKGSSHGFDLNQPPLPKQRRRKHRRKVITEGKPKGTRKPVTPKPVQSKTKRKYVRKKGLNKTSTTPPTEVPQPTKKSCRSLNFEIREAPRDENSVPRENVTADLDKGIDVPSAIIMSGKRTRRQQGESSSNRDFDPSRFKSLDHKKRYDEIENRDFIRERGFDLKGEYPEILERIRNLGWERLCESASRFCPNVVREFHANAFSVRRDEGVWERNASLVRGKTVFFSTNNINNFFGLHYGLGDCVLGEWMRHKYVRANLIINTLCREGARWDLNATGKETNFKKSDMKQIPKAWCTFVQSNLLPTSNRSEVTIERAVVIFLIVTGRVFNVGSLISLNLSKMVQKQGKRLGYPCLISNLCQRDEVPMANDPFRDPEGLITSQIIDGFAQNVRAIGEHQRAPPPLPQAPIRPRAPSLMQQIVDLQSSLNNLIATQNLHNRVVGHTLHSIGRHIGMNTPLPQAPIRPCAAPRAPSLMQQIDGLQSSLNNFIATQNQHNRVVVHALHSIGRHKGMNMDDWPLENPTHDSVDDINFDSAANQDATGDDEDREDMEEEDNEED